jgi:hypothetical protein
MIKEIFKYAKLCVIVNKMERNLKKMEYLYEILETDDFATFSLAFSIDNRIQECQEIIKGLKHRVKELDPKNFSK